MKTTPFKVGEKEFYLRYSVKALIKAEQLLGKSLSEVNLEKASLNDTIKIIYSGIQGNSETFEEFIDLLDNEGTDLASLFNVISKAFEQDFGSDEKN